MMQKICPFCGHKDFLSSGDLRTVCSSCGFPTGRCSNYEGRTSFPYICEKEADVSLPRLPVLLKTGCAVTSVGYFYDVEEKRTRFLVMGKTARVAFLSRRACFVFSLLEGENEILRKKLNVSRAGGRFFAELSVPGCHLSGTVRIE